jgi:hypothetical protein
MKGIALASAVLIVSGATAWAEDRSWLGGAPAFPSPSRPTLAVEDTLRQFLDDPLSEILVTAPRQTLDEILRRVAEGEARRDSLLQDQAFTFLVRFSGRKAADDPEQKSELYAESATRVYQKHPHKKRTVLLKKWSREEEKEKGGKQNVNVSFDADMSESFIAFAFDPKMRARFQFRIEDRKLVGDQVVYLLSFIPRSSLEPLPSGRVWVNTNDFVILREEFAYRDHSPFPLVIQSIDSCVLERTLIDHRYWVISRILARVTLTDPARWTAKLAGDDIPKVMDLALARTDWIINGGIPDSLFAPAGTGEAK